DSPAVENVARPLRVELAPQPARVGVEGPGPPLRAEAPDVAQELFLGEDAMRLRGKSPEQGELLVGQLHLPSIDRDPAPDRVHGQVADVDRAPARPGPAPQNR